VGCGYESGVVVEDCDEPSGVYDLKVALPEAVWMPALPAFVGSLLSGLGEWMVEPFTA